MKLKSLIFSILLPGSFFINHIQAQGPLEFSLKQAQEFAYENNYDLKNSAYDVQIAQKQVKQNTAIGLPQVNGGLDYVEYFMLPTSLIPGEFIGEPGTQIPIQFGSRYNMTLRGRADQLLYSGQYLVGLQTARAYLETQRQINKRAKINIRDSVESSYIVVLMFQEQAKILDSTYKVISQMVKELRETSKLGLIEDIEVDQLELNKSDLEARLINVSNQTDISTARLKYIMGLKENQRIKLTDSLTGFIHNLGREFLLQQKFDYNYNINYTVFKKQEYLVSMQYKLSKTSYQPTLSAFMSFNGNAQRSDWNFFESGQPWYKTLNWGMTLNIPIWSSGNRKYAVDQAYLQLQKMKVNDEKLKTGLELQVASVRNDFNNAYLLFLNKQKGLEVAVKIYKKTISKYKEGVATSTDLNQKYNQFLQSESDYLLSMFNVINLKIQLNKLLEKV
jgi:outer membrane protein TolC